MAVSLEALSLPDELPAIPNGWRYESLGDLLEERGVCYGIVQPGSETTDGIPIVRVNNIRNGRIDTTDMMKVDARIEAKFQRSRLRGGEVLLTLVGTLGEVAIVPDNLRGWNVARAVGVIPVRKDPGSLWVSICLRSEFIQHCIRTWATTTVQATFNLRDLAKLPIPIPPKEMRERIAAALGSLDDKIEVNRRMNATLEAMARALFQSWFVDFEPLRAKLDGRQLRSLDITTAALFPDSFDISAPIPIPKGWKLCRLRDIAEIFSGGTPKKHHASFWQGAIPWISPKAMTQIHVSDSDEHVSVTAIGNGTRQVPSGTVLVMVRGMGLHQGVRISQAQRDVTFNQDVKAIVAKSVPSTILFYGCLHAAPLLLSKVHSSGHGTGVLSTEFLDRLEFVIPPDEICDRLAQPLNVLNSRISTNNQESRTLAALRDTLLPKLLSGELRADGQSPS